MADQLGQSSPARLSLKRSLSDEQTSDAARTACAGRSPALYPLRREEDFSPKLKPVLEPYKKRMGFLPNALKFYAYRPEIAETLWKLNSNVMRDPSFTLDQLLKRKLAAIACAINGCAYCTAHSCSMLKKPRGDDFEGWGVSEDELQGLITGQAEPKDEFERACFDYVRAASEDPTSVPDECYGG